MSFKIQTLVLQLIIFPVKREQCPVRPVKIPLNTHAAANEQHENTLFKHKLGVTLITSVTWRTYGTWKKSRTNALTLIISLKFYPLLQN